MGRGKKGRNRPAVEPAPGRESRRSLFARMRRSVVAIADAPSVRLIKLVTPLRGGVAVTPHTPDMRDTIRIAGTGFTVYADGRFAVVLTAYHVIREWVNDRRLAQAAGQLATLDPFDSLHVLGEVRYLPVGREMQMDSFRARFEAVQFSESLDVAAILIRDPAGVQSARVYPAQISRSLPEDGDEVVICGFPLGHDLFLREVHPSFARPSFSAGIVSAALPYPNAPLESRHYFRLNAIVHRGNSGSPVFDLLSGEAVGVVATSLVEGGHGIAQPIGFAGATYALVAQDLVSDVLALGRRQNL
jgi:S1-C subfamily serine protease